MIRNKDVHGVVLEGTLIFLYIGSCNWFGSEIWKHNCLQCCIYFYLEDVVL